MLVDAGLMVSPGRLTSPHPDPAFRLVTADVVAAADVTGTLTGRTGTRDVTCDPGMSPSGSQSLLTPMVAQTVLLWSNMPQRLQAISPPVNCVIVFRSLRCTRLRLLTSSTISES